MTVRLKTLEKYINENMDGLTARIVKGYCNTDRKVGRLRIPGKGRIGNRLIVVDAEMKIVFDHNSAEPYRTNREVEQWIEDWEKGDRRRR